MKRRLTKLVVFLLLGAIVNIALAWGCTFWSRREPVSASLGWMLVLESDVVAWKRFKPADVSAKPFRSIRITGFGIYFLTMEGSRLDEVPLTLRVVEAGWPVRSMRGLKWAPTENDAVATFVASIPLNTVPIKHHRYPGNNLLPLAAIWPGFTINTLFYAAILWLPFGPFQLRRYVRVKRGHCIKCGYDLRGAEHEVCPECGYRRRA